MITSPVKNETLNPALYNSLVARFGTVKFSNEGQRLLVQMKQNEMLKYVEEIVDAGEYYRVCCPYCKDTRFRLYINHRWNTRTPDNKPYGRYMIVCFNESCDMSFFEDELKPYIADKPVLGRPFNVEREKLQTIREVQLPGQCVALASLPDYHPARNYIVSRRFDVKELTDTWGLQYCIDHPNPLVRGRIIIPVRWEEKLVGWQARAIGEASPKYYTMPGLNKNMILFNGDRARKFKFGVVVEGVFDAFRVGERAVSMLGKSMSYHQRQLVHAYWGGGACCIMLDADAIEDMKNTTKLFNPEAFKFGIFSVELPEGQDPGSMDKDSLWSLISSYARARNIPLTTC